MIAVALDPGTAASGAAASGVVASGAATSDGTGWSGYLSTAGEIGPSLVGGTSTGRSDPAPLSLPVVGLAVKRPLPQALAARVRQAAMATWVQRERHDQLMLDIVAHQM